MMASTLKRIVSGVLLAVIGLEGCSSAAPPPGAFIPNLPVLQLTAAPASVVELSGTGLKAGVVAPLFEIPEIPTNQGQLGLAMWGTQSAGGVITSVAQAEVLGLGTGKNTVHIFFNSSFVPVRFVDDASGYSIAITNESSAQPTITLCDPNGTADASTTLTVSDASIQIGPVASGGSCTVDAVAAASRTRMQVPAQSLSDLAKLIAAGSYVGGLGFALGAIMKFKAHKDNPTQIPVGTPIALLFIAAALIFLPTIFSSTGTTLFESSFVPVDGVEPLEAPN
jgi:intracellular multiplication protein IcmD